MLPYIVILEDDPQLNALLREHLSERYEVVSALNIQQAEQLLGERLPQLILLDLNLPDGDGLEFMARLRSYATVPVLMITARGAIQERVEGLNAGADDYLVKPFSLDELDARVKALLRRTSAGERQVLNYHDTQLNLSSLTVTVQGRQEQLTEHEARILEVMMRTPGRVFSRSDLEVHLYGWETPQSNSIEVRISQLRKKLREVGSPINIRTIRGVGYTLPA
ncbi:DNA-binding response OmpR family regulator [Deinobacterium chartae]|uniref:DNA-binding response OmpR family regulator n=1 Tax=Deinobacterium chartae TaxID=521158 RepID=A0A841I7Y7_9DEIO|nr:response regulator transcription factor [Deinobacterium chartae]MBB6099952.1 DNA-binding response OmpR family regulator [Deinobacterium chartae]